MPDFFYDNHLHTRVYLHIRLAWKPYNQASMFMLTDPGMASQP